MEEAELLHFQQEFEQKMQAGGSVPAAKVARKSSALKTSLKEVSPKDDIPISTDSRKTLSSQARPAYLGDIKENIMDPRQALCPPPSISAAQSFVPAKKPSRFAQQRRAQNQNPDSGLSKVPPPSVHFSLDSAIPQTSVENMKESVDRENQQLLDSLPDEEIQEARRDLESSISPDLRRILRRLHKKRQPVEEARSIVRENVVQLEADIPNESDSTTNQPHAANGTPKKRVTFADCSMDNAIPTPTDRIEIEKLKWTEPVSKEEASISGKTLRFDFQGNLVLADNDDDKEYRQELHHHGQEPHLAGYTIEELFVLSRSKVSAQSVVGLKTLGLIGKQMRQQQRCYPQPQLSQIRAEWEKQNVGVHLRLMLDMASAPNVLVAALDALYAWIVESDPDWDLFGPRFLPGWMQEIERKCRRPFSKFLAVAPLERRHQPIPTNLDRLKGNECMIGVPLDTRDLQENWHYEESEGAKSLVGLRMPALSHRMSVAPVETLLGMGILVRLKFIVATGFLPMANIPSVLGFLHYVLCLDLDIPEGVRLTEDCASIVRGVMEMEGIEGAEEIWTGLLCCALRLLQCGWRDGAVVTKFADRIADAMGEHGPWIGLLCHLEQLLEPVSASLPTQVTALWKVPAYRENPPIPNENAPNDEWSDGISEWISSIYHGAPIPEDSLLNLVNRLIQRLEHTDRFAEVKLAVSLFMWILEDERYAEHMRSLLHRILVLIPNWMRGFSEQERFQLQCIPACLKQYCELLLRKGTEETPVVFQAAFVAIEFALPGSEELVRWFLRTVLFNQALLSANGCCKQADTIRTNLLPIYTEMLSGTEPEQTLDMDAVQCIRPRARFYRLPVAGGFFGCPLDFLEITQRMDAKLEAGPVLKILESFLAYWRWWSTAVCLRDCTPPLLGWVNLMRARLLLGDPTDTAALEDWEKLAQHYARAPNFFQDAFDSGTFPTLKEWKILALFKDILEVLFTTYPGQARHFLELLVIPFLSTHVPRDFQEEYWRCVSTYRSCGFSAELDDSLWPGGRSAYKHASDSEFLRHVDIAVSQGLVHPQSVLTIMLTNKFEL